MNICVVFGTRPEIIKMQPVISEIKKRNHKLLLIHTGQHYDEMMSDVFIKELKIPKPDHYLKVKPTSQGAQTGEIISLCEKVLISEKPHLILVLGDTNSALGASIAAAKIKIPIGHVEAGCRSFDIHTSEEINRSLIADISSLNFAPTTNCVTNLSREGIPEKRIFLTGHPLVDLLSEINNNISYDRLKIGISSKNYYLFTLHRRENIEDKFKLSKILIALDRVASDTSVIFPCHPHTKMQIRNHGLESLLKNIMVVDTVGYLESLRLIKNARIVLTDSGGIQQECALLRTPCITLRDVTEWIETIHKGINFLPGYESETILDIVSFIENNYSDIAKRFDTKEGMFGWPGVSKKILTIIENEKSLNF